jgi:hypothetical protein
MVHIHTQYAHRTLTGGKRFAYLCGDTGRIFPSFFKARKVSNLLLCELKKKSITVAFFCVNSRIWPDTFMVFVGGSSRRAAALDKATCVRKHSTGLSRHCFHSARRVSLSLILFCFWFFALCRAQMCITQVAQRASTSCRGIHGACSLRNRDPHILPSTKSWNSFILVSAYSLLSQTCGLPDIRKFLSVKSAWGTFRRFSSSLVWAFLFQGWGDSLRLASSL